MIAARIAFSDRSKTDARARFIDEHKAYLRHSALRIVFSGPFQGSMSGQTGALIVADVASLDELETFSANDPFVIHQVYATVSIVQWTVTIGSLPSVAAC